MVEVAPTAVLYVLVTKGCWTSNARTRCVRYFGALLAEENIALAPTVADPGRYVELHQRCGRRNSEYVTAFPCEALPLLLRHENVLQRDHVVAKHYRSLCCQICAQ